MFSRVTVLNIFIFIYFFFFSFFSFFFWESNGVQESIANEVKYIAAKLGQGKPEAGKPEPNHTYKLKRTKPQNLNLTI